jgi:hypothetical protein
MVFFLLFFQEFCELEKVRGKLLRSRKLQYLLAFSYWPAIEPRTGSNLYEIRSYILKPGTMIEWGNNWARAINYRRNNDEAFAGFFSQIGRLYNVHHIWCKYSLIYKNKYYYYKKKKYTVPTIINLNYIVRGKDR